MLYVCAKNGTFGFDYAAMHPKYEDRMANSVDFDQTEV